MDPQPPNVFPAGFERTSLLFLLAAIAAAGVAFAAFPLPAFWGARVVEVLAVVAVDFAIFGALWHRALTAHRAVAREKLERAEREVAHAERLASVGRIAAGIAHEVGNPLTGIANYTHILRARADASPESQAALSGIEREVERIDRIVSGLLDFSRPQKGTSKPVDAAVSLRHAVELLAEQGVFRTVHVQTTIGDTPLPLVGNPQEFEQVFVNVLLNAIDAMARKGTLSVYAGRASAETVARPPKRRSGDAESASSQRSEHPKLATWRAHHDGDDAVAKFVIADSGPGVDSRFADRVFDPFFTTKGDGEGSGLGLAIVQRVVDSHDGVVWVQRAREGGAAFHIVFPLGAFPASREQVS